MPKTPGSYIQGEHTYITVFHPDHPVPLIADSSHPNFAEIESLFLDNDAEHPSPEMFDPSVEVAKKFEKVSRRVSVSGGQIYFDGDRVDNALTKAIVRFIEEGVEDWKPLVRFFEKVADNPQEHSRTQLYEWLDRHEFTIAENGDIVGYKGCKGTIEEPLSIHFGPGIVDGVRMNGHLPNKPGSIIEIERSAVHHDPAVGCSTGLHVGTYEYASSFSQGVLLEVHVNPTDVVSVPTDCNWAKVRTCRYEVIKAISVPYTSAVRVGDDDWDYDSDEDWDEDWDDDEDYGLLDSTDEDDSDEDEPSDEASEDDTPDHLTQRIRHLFSDGDEKAKQIRWFG